jgi:hypothetical protein
MEERIRPRLVCPLPPLFHVDDKPWELCNALQIDFERDEPFDRRPEAIDAFLAYCFDVLNGVLTRLRILVMSSFVRPVEVKDIIGRLAFLDENGDEFPLVGDRETLRAKAFKRTSGRVITLSPKVWAALQVLPQTFRPALWDVVLLDAFAILENVGEQLDTTGMRADIGAALVLAHTAIEMRIDDALARLAGPAGLSEEFWTWLSLRDHDIARQPSVEEKLGVLLKLLGGRSLKSDQDLWREYQRLRSSRNGFVHRGVLEYDHRPLTIDKADALLRTALCVLDFIESGLPEDQRRPPTVDSGTKTITVYQIASRGRPESPQPFGAAVIRSVTEGRRFTAAES